MKKLVLIFCALLYFAFSLSVSSQSLDQIIDMHFDAAKQDKFNKLKTITITYQVTIGNRQGTVNEFHKRNSKLRIEEHFGNKTTVKGYDGKIGWQINPDNPKPIKLSGKDLEKIKFLADLDGYFYCWRNKGHKLKLLGEEKLRNIEVYKIECTKTNGDEAELYLDAKKYLLVKSIQKIKEDGKINTEETIIDNYKIVNGIPFPSKFEVKSNGNIKMETVKDIKLDSELPDSLFTAPNAL